MCGIVGMIDFENKVDNYVLKKMRDKLSHRGPDDSGIFISKNGNVGLGHRRLSIIDLSLAGHQPMCNEDGSLWLVYNGEIYNFIDIKIELQERGHIFKSNTDSEVIIHGYEEWGEEVLSYFRGMFAFAIWNEKNETLFCARDRFGIKPFYYYMDSKKFIFGSELKSILAHPDVDKSIEETSVYDFFTYLYIPSPKTILKKAFKLEPGHILKWHNKNVSIRKYWDIDFSKQIKISEIEAEMELRKKMHESVKIRLVSDVPVGIFLSGGLDSSAIATYANKETKKKLKTFSMGFKDSYKDETQYSRLMAKILGSEHIEKILIKEDAYKLNNFIIGLYDEPFADSSAIPTYLISKIARKDVTVVLSGDGGDEVFGGYEWYSKFISRYFNMSGSIISMARRTVNILSKFYPNIRGKYRIKRFSADNFEYYAMLMGGTYKRDKGMIFNKKFLKNFKDYDDYWFFKKFWKNEYDIFSRLQYLDLKTYLPEDILTKVDIASMAVSLEVRVPFLDHKLAEFIASIPWEIRNKNYQKKYLFKKSLSSVLPSSILNKKKQGFSVPLNEYISIDDIPKSYNSILNDILCVNKKSISKDYTKIWQVMNLCGSINNIIRQ